VKLSIKEALQRGRARAKEGRSRREAKFSSAPASPNKLIRLFNSKFQENDYGSPLPLAQKTRGMLNGFIRLGRNNGWEEKKFYGVITDVVENWETLKRKEIRTLNGKKVLLSDRPSLLEFLIARDSILSKLYEIKNEELKEDEVKITSIETEEKKFSPSEEDMESEMEKQMEDYLNNF